MLDRIIERRILATKKSILLLGPRQVGKSTLVSRLKPTLYINLAREDEFLKYSKNPSHLRELIEGEKIDGLIALDEIQRVPKLLNEVQDIHDNFGKRFVLTGSSAIKLRALGVNLLPGRIIKEFLDPLTILEIDAHNLDRMLQLGTLPGIYLDKEEGHRVLESYASIYLREEIREQALVRDIGMFSRFLDIAALLSGQWLNYSKVASDIEIPKETVRRFFSLLEDTLLMHRIPSFKPQMKISSRRISQREKIVFFDTGVRNAILGVTRAPLSPENRGNLFEQFFLIQCIGLNRAFDKNWRISSYLTPAGAEVDVVIEQEDEIIGIEVKSGKAPHSSWFSGLRSLKDFIGNYKPFRGFVAYTGRETLKKEDDMIVMPYDALLRELCA